MGLFSRAYRAALDLSGNSITQAAALAGLSQPSVSRIVAGDSLPDPANLGRLLQALDEPDRAHCLRQYLLEHTPDNYQGRLILSFGETAEAKAPPRDELGDALHFLEQEATHDKHLERVLVELALTFSGSAQHNVRFQPPVEEHIQNASVISTMRQKNLKLLTLPVSHEPTERRTIMSEKHWCAMCGKWGNHSSGGCPELTGAPAPSEPPATQGSLRCDGVVGLRSDEADALSQEWMGRSLKCAARSREDSAAGRETLAWCNEVRSSTYLLCADELRQHAGLPIPRQPEPNGRDEPRAGSAATPKQ